MTVTPSWLILAHANIGISEIPGKLHEPRILAWWRAVRLGGIKTDEVPWCAAFVGAMLEQSGIRSTRSDAARSYLRWGVELSAPVVGCIVIFERGAGGHVGFVVGRDERGRLLVLGGNQDNRVKISAFSAGRVLAYRWPAGHEVPISPLPLASAAASISEA